MSKPHDIPRASSHADIGRLSDEALQPRLRSGFSSNTLAGIGVDYRRQLSNLALIQGNKAVRFQPSAYTDGLPD